MISKVLVSNSAMSGEAPKIAMPRLGRAVIPAASGGIGHGAPPLLCRRERDPVSQPPTPTEPAWAVMGLNVIGFRLFLGPVSGLTILVGEVPAM